MRHLSDRISSVCRITDSTVILVFCSFTFHIECSSSFLALFASPLSRRTLFLPEVCSSTISLLPEKKWECEKIFLFLADIWCRPRLQKLSFTLHPGDYAVPQGYVFWTQTPVCLKCQIFVLTKWEMKGENTTSSHLKQAESIQIKNQDGASSTLTQDTWTCVTSHERMFA